MQILAPIYQSGGDTSNGTFSLRVTPCWKGPNPLQTLHLPLFQARARAAPCSWAWNWTGWRTRASSSRRGPPPPSRPITPSVTYFCYHFQWCFWNLRKSQVETFNTGQQRYMCHTRFVENLGASSTHPHTVIGEPTKMKKAVTQWSKWDDSKPNYSFPSRISIFIKKTKILRNQIFSMFLS